LRIPFYSVDLLRTQAGERGSQLTLRDCSKEVREESGYIGGQEHHFPHFLFRELPLAYKYYYDRTATN